VRHQAQRVRALAVRLVELEVHEPDLGKICEGHHG
jgi:hypothetical protein